MRPVRRGDRPRGVGADVRAALLLGHAHPDEGAALVGERPQPEVVAAGGELGQPARREGGLAARAGAAAYVIEMGHR